jgi:hypothetical protein
VSPSLRLTTWNYRKGGADHGFGTDDGTFAPMPSANGWVTHSHGGAPQLRMPGGKVVDLPPITGTTRAVPTAVSDNGRVVGGYTLANNTGENVPVIWRCSRWPRIP